MTLSIEKNGILCKCCQKLLLKISYFDRCNHGYVDYQSYVNVCVLTTLAVLCKFQWGESGLYQWRTSQTLFVEYRIMWKESLAGQSESIVH